MKMQGRLNLSHNKCDYLMFYQGRNINLSDYLYAMYKDKACVSVQIKDLFTGKILFHAEGELWKEKVQPKFYTYHIGEYDLDGTLWDCVGRKVEIYIKNVTIE